MRLSNIGLREHNLQRRRGGGVQRVGEAGGGMRHGTLVGGIVFKEHKAEGS